MAENSTSPNLILIIPATAVPQNPVDMKAMCAPPNAPVPAHLRVKFGHQSSPTQPTPEPSSGASADSSSPEVNQVTTPATAAPANPQPQYFQPIITMVATASLDPIEPTYSVAPVHSGEVFAHIEDSAPESASIEKEVPAREIEVKAEEVISVPVNADETVAVTPEMTTEESTKDSEASELGESGLMEESSGDFEDDGESLPESTLVAASESPVESTASESNPNRFANSSVADIENSPLQSELNDEVKSEIRTSTQRVARDVNRFIAEEQAADGYEYQNDYAADDYVEFESLSASRYDGFTTLGLAILTIVILSLGTFFAWKQFVSPTTNIADTDNDSTTKIDITTRPDAVNDPKNVDTTEAPPKTDPKLEQLPKQPIDNTDPEKNDPAVEAMTDDQIAAIQSEIEAKAFAELGDSVEAKVDYEIDPKLNLSDAVKLEVEVGVEEDQPGLIARIEALRSQALQAENEKRYAAAIDLYRQILELRPKDAGALMRSGLAYFQLDDLDNAELNFKQAEAANADAGKIANNLGVVYLKRGQADKARVYFEQACYHSNPDGFCNAAKLLAESGKSLHALQYYRKALNVNPEHPEARLGLAITLMQDDEEAAKRQLTELQSHPEVGARAQMTLGELAFKRENYQEAQDLSRSAIDSDETLIDARQNYALANLKLGKVDEAIAQLKLVVAEKPRDAKAWNNMGLALMESGNKKKAKECFEFSLKLDANNPTSHYNYANCAESYKNYLIALQEYEKTLQIDPFYWQAAYNTGLIYARGGKYQKALAAFDQAIQVNSKFALNHYNRARVLFKLKREEDGVVALKTYLKRIPETDPNYKKVEKILVQWERAQRDKILKQNNF